MKKIVLLYSELIPSVRLCGYEQLSYLAKCGILDFEAVPLRAVTRKCLKQADAVIFLRGDSDFECYLAKKLAQAGKYLIYVLDDDLLNVPDYLASYPHYGRDSVKGNVRTLMRCCDCLLTPSEKIAKKYSHLFTRTVLIEEPALDCIFPEEKDGPVKLGFAGSVDRTLDFDSLVTEPLRRIKKRFGDDVVIEFFGIKPAIAEELNCKCYPYAENYGEYQNTMKSLHWDIGLAPIPDTEFHSCKHYNKFIEYGSYGIISVCSDLAPYDRIIRNWENGVLCPNDADAWETVLCRLIEDAQLRKRIQRSLHEQIRSSFQLPQVAKDLWARLDACVPVLPRHTLGWMLPNRLRWRIMWAYSKIDQHGWKLPFAVLRKLLNCFGRKKRNGS